MTRYVYFPLDDKAKEIRLMTLLPGIWSSKVRVTLQKARLTEDVKPQYEALSYVWGSAENLANIQIGQPNATLDVTQNLAVALQYLRYEDKPRDLWIDAICVDQQNLTERGQQVQRMPQVYSFAEQVLVWLGPEDKTSSSAIDTFRTLSSRIKVNWLSFEMKPTSPEYIDWANPAKVFPYEESTVDAIHDLLKRPWFERLWIHQEIRLANPSAVIMCGFDKILWQEFCDAILCMNLKSFSKPDKGLRQRITLAFELRTKFYNLGQAIRGRRRSMCSDPRDRVYALLSVATGAERDIDIKPDYRKTVTVTEVYQEYFLKSLGHSRQLGLLCVCELQDKDTTMPSWVPDWSVPSGTARYLTGHRASGNSACNVQYEDPGKLKVTGVHCVVIRDVQDASNGSTTVVDTLRRLFPSEALDTSNLYMGGGSLFDAYCQTWYAGRFAENFLPPYAGLPSLQETKKNFRHILTNNPNLPLGSSLHFGDYYELVHGFVTGRSLVTTAEGYIGLAPRRAKAGDVICVLLGCAAPMVLRPVESGQYKVVGESYVCGLMDCEALLGPLPSHFQFVRQFDTEYGYCAAYLNHETGKTYVDDPRLGQLPAGWRKHGHRRERIASLFVEDRSATSTWADPRLSIEALAARNVALTEFELI